jgi:hypothetical protein
MNFLKGYKTYIIAAGAILTALGAYLSDSISLTDLVMAIFAALTAMGMRAGINNAAADVIKKVGLFALCASMLGLTSCANLQNIQQTLGTPAAVQADLVILGAVAAPHIPDDAKVKIHAFAGYLNQAADLNLDALFALLPGSTGSQNGDALIAAAKAYLTAVVQRYGERNQTAIAYGHAVANGLLANF